jgi:phosphoglycerate dehydrogenase-like enzyme
MEKTLAAEKTLVVAFELNGAARQTVSQALDGAAEFICLPDIAPAEREAVLRRAGALLAWNFKEFQPAEFSLLAGLGLVQFMTAGVDFLPLSALPAGVRVAGNGGAYAEPMAEHALAMAFAAAKRIVPAHAEIARGEFHQFTPNRMLGGGVCGILGFGGIGLATARLMRGIGMRVYGINRSGRPDPALDWIGTPEKLEEMLAASDVLVICAPLTKATMGMIGARELGWMKPDAILVNVARGEIVDEAALYAHLRAHPKFSACIDAWWIEPVRHGEFRMDHPFMTLPNVIGSPHNSAQVPAYRVTALRRAVENCRRALQGETPLHLVRAEDRLL